MNIIKSLSAVSSLIIGTAFVSAQDKPNVYMSADLTSAYLWRGQKNAGVSLQPVLGLKWKGLNLYLWGNEQLAPGDNPSKAKYEIDFFLKYSPIKQFTLGLKDVYVSTRGNGFFSHGTIPHSSHGLDVLLACDFKFVNAEWTTTIIGYDGYSLSGKRSYGSYLIINAPFAFCHVDWIGTVGVVPYYCSRYDDDSHGFHVNMLSLKASHTFTFGRNKSMGATPYMTFMVNPSARTAYFQVGARWSFNP